MTRDLRPILSPRSIAIVGASERSFIARVAIENCRTMDYRGQVFPIHHRHERVLGLRCYSALSDLPEVPDCVLIAVNAERAVAAVEEACAIGVGAVVLPAGGFAELGADGAERQRRVVDAAAASGTLVVGPNCMGVISPPDQSAVYIGTIARRFETSTISAIAQSGSVIEALVNTPHLHFARLFSAGNEAALTTCDYLEYLLDDDRSGVVMLYMEAYREPGRLLALCERALRAGKPLVMVALGRSAQAQEMALAHSGALATGYRRLAAALRQRGVMLCDDLDEWMATAQLAAAGVFPRGIGVGAVTVSGGEGALVVDLAEACGVKFPALSAGAQRRMSDRFPAFIGWPNPTDGWDKGPYEEVYPVVLGALADEPTVDVVVAAVDMPAGQGQIELDFTTFIGRSVAAEARRAGKPAAYVTVAGGALDERVRSALAADGLSVVGGARNGLRAIAHLAGLAARRAAGVPTSLNMPEFDADFIARLASELPIGAADEVQSRAVLAAAGVPLIEVREVTDVGGAVVAARELGGTVVVKAVLPGVAHKSDAGAVALRLDTEADITEAAERLLCLCHLHGAPRRLLVSRFVEPQTELIAGIACDPQWGAFVLVGLGGVLAEALDDPVIVATPLLDGQAQQVVGAGVVGRVLSSPRRPADIDAVVDLLRRLDRLARLLWSVDRSIAVDLNPVFVLRPGEGAWAADALITRSQWS